MTMDIKTFTEEYTDDVLSLWKSVNLCANIEEARADILTKLSFQPELFFVAIHHKDLLGTCMAGFDGHRGWIYYLAVNPNFQKRGIGKALIHHAEIALKKLRCSKVLLMVADENIEVSNFYKNLNFETSPVKVFGKKIH